jgi:nucleoside-diphosphate-sugar epimerase
MKEKILLTGATGFIGSHILKRLIELGEDVVIILRETSNLERIQNLNGFSVFKVNKQLSNLDELYEKYQINTIIHLSTEYGRSLDYTSVLLSNVIFPIKLLEKADKKKLKLFINTDSFSSKFQDSSYLKEYISSKKIFKDYLKSIFEFQVINLQLEHVIGEYDSNGKFITFLFDEMLSSQKQIKLTEGKQKRDFIYIADVVDAYMVTLKYKNYKKNFVEFEVGTGQSISIKEFVSTIHKILQSKSELLFGSIETRSDEIMESSANNLDLVKLGWEPKYTIEIAIQNILKTKIYKNHNL